MVREDEAAQESGEGSQKEPDFEAALQRALADGEQVEAIWQVSPGRYLLGLVYLSRFLKVGAILALFVLGGAIYAMTQVSQSFWQGSLRLPSTAGQWCLLFVFLAAARSYEQQYEEEDQPAGALTPLFRERVELDWLERENERHPEGCARLRTGGLLVWVGFLSYFAVRPTTTRQWLAWGVGAVVVTAAYRGWQTWTHHRSTAPVRCVAGGSWWQLIRPEGVESRFVPVAVLPLLDLHYAVHHGTIYVPQQPLQVQADWTEGETDALGEIAEAARDLPPPGAFSPEAWHALQPARPRLLQHLDRLGAQRVAG